METKLIDKFFKMELEAKLFDISDVEGTPIWDVLRLHVYFRYYYPAEELSNLFEIKRKTWTDYLFLVQSLFKSLVYLFFKRGTNVFLTVSRDRNQKGEHFDKSAQALIESYGNDVFIIEVHKKVKFANRTLNSFIGLFRPLIKVTDLRLSDYRLMETAFEYYLGKNIITYDELNLVYRSFQQDFRYYKKLFKFLKSKSVFVSRGNEKAALWAAKVLDINTIELQHAAFEWDNILYSYPSLIKQNSNVVMPDYLLTFGEYWGAKMNIPVKKIWPIGNDNLCNQQIIGCDNSILIVSTIIHAKDLSELTLIMAKENPNMQFNFKLHINEYKNLEQYKIQFSNFANVSIICGETDIHTLIAKSQLVILILSTVLYEALNQNKRVAIYKRLNYHSQENVFNNNNVFLMESSLDLKPILQQPIRETPVTFFKPFDVSLLEKLKHTIK